MDKSRSVIATTPEASMAEAAPPLRVFLVEDSRAVAELLTEQLNDIPDVLVVGVAESERAALDALDATPCDVLIVDIKLREGNGIGLLRRLAATDASAPRPATCIVFSNYTENEYRILAKRYGAQHFFDKSTDLRALLALVVHLSNGE
jgi:DNA-binding NarL/FixJ family response regulator